MRVDQESEPRPDHSLNSDHAIPEFSQDFDAVFGPEADDLARIPRSRINIASQMREGIDPGHMLEIRESIENIGLKQNPEVYFLDQDMTREYVELSNKIWGGDTDVDDFVESNGGYFVLVAGEHRTRAIDLKISDDNLDPDNVAISCQLRTCDSITEIIESQLAENLHLEPSPQQFAQGLMWMYELGKKDGTYENEAEFIADSGVSYRRARNALNYFKLPDSAREAVDFGQISYSHAISLYPYLEPYRQYIADQEIALADQQELVEEEFKSKIQLVVGNNWSARETGKISRQWGADLTGLQQSFEDMFLETEDPAEIERRRILKNRRGLLNKTAQDLSATNDALGMLYRDVEINGLEPNIKRNLDSLRELLSTLSEQHTGKELGVLALERMAEIEAVTAAIPEAEQDGFGF